MTTTITEYWHHITGHQCSPFCTLHSLDTDHHNFWTQTYFDTNRLNHLTSIDILFAYCRDHQWKSNGRLDTDVARNNTSFLEDFITVDTEILAYWSASHTIRHWLVFFIARPSTIYTMTFCDAGHSNVLCCRPTCVGSLLITARRQYVHSSWASGFDKRSLALWCLSIRVYLASRRRTI